VGAVIIHSVSRWIPKGHVEAQQRAMILAGGAAGVAAAFNTPLAGIVFAIEELSRSFEERASGTTLTAVILAGIVAIALTGDYTYFGQPTVAAAALRITPVVVLVAVACGLAGGVFSRVTLVSAAGLPGALGRLRRKRPALFAACCGLGIAGLGTWAHGLTFGTGYAEARSILESQVHLPWNYALARALATLLSFLSGIPAGLLAPSLSVGAGLGQFIADLLHEPSAVPFAILGMCGFLAGVTQAPLTSFVIVMEMTSQHAMVLPLMLTAAVATALSRLITPPLYQALADRYAGGDKLPDGNGKAAVPARPHVTPE
jgi:H+/Cl- antiporter ClcA